MGLCRRCPTTTTVPVQPRSSFSPKVCLSCSALPGVESAPSPSGRRRVAGSLGGIACLDAGLASLLRSLFYSKLIKENKRYLGSMPPTACLSPDPPLGTSRRPPGAPTARQGAARALSAAGPVLRAAGRRRRRRTRESGGGARSLVSEGGRGAGGGGVARGGGPIPWRYVRGGRA